MSQSAKLAVFWLVGFLLTLVVFLTLFFVKFNLPHADLKRMLQPIMLLFAPYLAPMIAFFVVVGKQTETARKSDVYIVTFIVSILFFVGTVFPLGALLLAKTPDPATLTVALQGGVESSADIGGLLAFVVGPVIGYYFGSRQ